MRDFATSATDRDSTMLEAGRHEEFAAYALARWTPMVRTVLLLGGPDRVAQEVVGDALGHCRRRWSELVCVDVDVEAYDQLLECWHRRCLSGWPYGADRVLPDEVEAGLDRLDRGTRERLVLIEVAGIHPHDAAELAGVSVPVTGEPPPIAADLIRSTRSLGSSLSAGPVPSVDSFRATTHPSRLGPALGSVALVLVVVAAAAVWGLTRPGRDVSSTPRAVEVIRTDNPAPVSWFASGRLHLSSVTAVVSSMRDFVGVADEAVYGDQAGRVVLLRGDGSRVQLGVKAPDVPLVSYSDPSTTAPADVRVRVAWIDLGAPAPQLVLYDVVAERTVVRRPLNTVGASNVRVRAVDGDQVYFSDGAGDHVLDLTTSSSEDVRGGGLRDVAAGTRAFQADARRLRLTSLVYKSEATVVGVDATLAPDGRTVLTQVPDGRSAYGAVRIYLVRTGRRLASGLDETTDVAIAATLGSPGRVTYLVARARDRPDDILSGTFTGPLELRTCLVGTDKCVVEARFRDRGSTPLLSG